jgi:hypothetical protein
MVSDQKVIFETLRGLLQAYQPPFIPKTSSDRYFDLWSLKPVVIEGRKKKEVFFAGLIIQKDYVGFYYMPVYVEAEIKTLFQPELLARLKGKSCFHIRKLDDQLVEQIKEALKTGFELYQQRGWV